MTLVRSDWPGGVDLAADLDFDPEEALADLILSRNI
jgi:hypothetical protein